MVPAFFAAGFSGEGVARLALERLRLLVLLARSLARWARVEAAPALAGGGEA